jgi:hypothetical protein
MQAMMQMKKIIIIADLDRAFAGGGARYVPSPPGIRRSSGAASLTSTGDRRRTHHPFDLSFA